jgi:Leucine-rich repeat (LRR) protein
MYNDFYKKFIEILDENSILDKNKITGCLKKEIRDIESCQNKLPVAYTQFLEFLGKNAGKLFYYPMFKIYYEDLKDKQQYIKEFLDYSKFLYEFPSNAFIFGYNSDRLYYFLLANNDDNPMVFCLDYYQSIPHLEYNSFLEFLFEEAKMVGYQYTGNQNIFSNMVIKPEWNINSDNKISLNFKETISQEEYQVISALEAKIGNIDILNSNKNLYSCPINGIVIRNNHVIGLNINDKNIKELPEDFGNLKWLEECYLNRNSLSYLPESIYNLEKLKILIISSNDLKNLPIGFKNLKSLEILDLSKNKLKYLADSLKNMINLQKISLRSNSLEEFELINKKNLKTLILAQNNLKNIDISSNNWNSLQKCDFSNNKIEKITDICIKLKNTEYLDLSNNQLTSLPQEIGKMMNLKRLKITGNNINKIPKSFSKLINLIELEYQDFDFSPNNLEIIEKLPNYSEFILF